MRRGELYRVGRPSDDPKPARVFVVVSRRVLIDSSYSTVVCAPVFNRFHALPTQVHVGTAEGLTHDCAIQCDGLMSLEKARLTGYVGKLGHGRLRELNAALAAALALPARAQSR